jgi:site-specific recombinase XerD
MRRAGETDHGLRLRALIVVLWRAGLRIGEAMALTEPDLDPSRGSILVRQGKGGKRREVGMDIWGFDQLQPWLARRLEMPVGTLFVEMAREGVSLKVIQRQLGRVNLGVTSVYLDGIDTAEIIDTVHNRRGR